MKTIATLGLLVGGILFVPKGLIAVAVAIWVVSRMNPLLSVLLFTGALVFGGRS